MSDDWRDQLRNVSPGGESGGELTGTLSIEVGGMTVSVGDIVTIESPGIFLPSRVKRKDLKVKGIDPVARVITFEGYPDPLYLEIVDQETTILTKTRPEIRSPKEAVTPEVGDTIRLASNYGKIQLIRGYRGETLNQPLHENPMKLDTGAVIENIITQGNDTILIVRPVTASVDQRLYSIIMSNKVNVFKKQRL